MFNKSEIEQFRSQGWVAKAEFWTAREVGAMRVELDRLKAVGLLRNVATAGDSLTESATSSTCSFARCSRTAISTAPCPSPKKRSRLSRS